MAIDKFTLKDKQCPCAFDHPTRRKCIRQLKPENLINVVEFTDPLHDVGQLYLNLARLQAKKYSELKVVSLKSFQTYLRRNFELR